MEDYLGTYKNRPRTVVFYGRVSTEHEQQISALGNQMEWYANLAERNPNWTVVAQYIDEGITGTQMKKRPSFMQMMDHARQRQFDLIVTRELSRFARNTVDALKATRELKQYGVEVYFVNDGIWTMDGDGEVRLTIMASIAQDESRKTSERVKAGQKISRENGVLYGTGNVLGYDLDKVNKTYTINEEQADTVRRVYELYANGYGETAVANMLMAEGRKDGGGGCTWTASKVSRVLRKPVYKGYKAYNQSHVKDYLSHERIYHSERDYSLVKGDFPPIVSEKLWDTCFAIRKDRAAHNMDKEGRTYGFGTGFPQNKWAKVLYCECGARYQCEGHDKRRNGRSDVRLMCSATKKLSKRVRDEKGFGVPCPLPYTWDWKMEMIAKKMYQTIWVTHNDASFGYVYDRQHKTLAIEADKVEAVRKIFEMYADGISCSIIADELNMQGIRNKDGSDSWTTMQVRGIIKNPIYKGYMYRRVVSCTDYLTHKSVSIPEEEREYVKGNFPPIVSEELWEKCRRRRASCGPRKQ